MSCLVAHDGDSVIIVNEQKGKKQDSRLVFVFYQFILFISFFYEELHSTLVITNVISNMILILFNAVNLFHN